MTDFSCCDPVDVAAARQLADAASKPPWRAVDWNGDWMIVDEDSDPYFYGEIAGNISQGYDHGKADAAFIAVARSLVPALLDDLVRVSGELANTQTALAAVANSTRTLRNRVNALAEAAKVSLPHAPYTGVSWSALIDALEES